ncbi:MAG: RnfABCDGE type electron transport complex subunit D [Bacteriovoracaceae bacterium]|nr:RnfABCDGE type electron transport complex subunit D [Bacteriovoracaceae bacterium]
MIIPGVILILLWSLCLQFIFDHSIEKKFNWKSAFISTLSLTLLLKSDSMFVWLMAPLFTIAPKFVLRHKGKHFFNPTNLGIVLCLLLFSEFSWVSPGQWGRDVFFIGLLLFAGVFVCHKSSRIDTPFYFLGFHLLFLASRTVWLGDPFTIAIHRVQNISLLIFAFLMISDPRTTPDSKKGRILFCATVAGLTYYFDYVLYIRESLFYALALTSLLTPILNNIYPGSTYQWENQSLASS